MATPTPTARKPYTPPSLIAYGTVEQVTRTKQICSSNDIFGFLLDHFLGDNGKDIDWKGCALS